MTGNKLRPAVILTETNLDITVAFVTTQLQWQEPTDVFLQPTPASGIKKNSLIRLSKIATIDRLIVVGKIGMIDAAKTTELNIKLKLLFRIP